MSFSKFMVKGATQETDAIFYKATNAGWCCSDVPYYIWSRVRPPLNFAGGALYLSVSKTASPYLKAVVVL